MSNRRKRQARRRTAMTPAQRWHADRYRPPRQYTPAQIRTIILDDGVARRVVPLTWYLQAIRFVAAKEAKTVEDVHVEMEQACVAACGLPMPTTGDLSTL